MLQHFRVLCFCSKENILSLKPSDCLPGAFERQGTARRPHPAILGQLSPSKLYLPHDSWVNFLTLWEFLSFSVFVAVRYLQAIILYPLSQAAHIKFFSSCLINQSLNPSKPFNRTCCSSLNSIQFPPSL